MREEKKKSGRSIVFSLVLSTLLSISVAAAVLSLLSVRQSRMTLERSVEERVERFERAYEDGLRRTGVQLGLALEILQRDTDLVAAFADRDRERLAALTVPAFTGSLQPNYGIAQFQFHLPDGTSFLRAHRPDEFGDDLTAFRQTVVVANRNNRSVVGLEIGRGGLGYRVVYPVFAGNALAGTVELGAGIGSVLASARELTDVQTAVAVREEVFRAGGRPDSPDTDYRVDDLIFYTYSTPAITDLLDLLSGGVTRVRVDRDGNTFDVRTISLQDFANAEIGVIAVVTDLTETLATQRRRLAQQLSVLAITAAILLSTLMVAILAGVVRPVQALATELRGISHGTADLTAQLAIRSRNEVGIVAESYNTFVGRLREIVESLKSAVLKGNEIGRQMSMDADGVVEMSREVETQLQTLRNESGSLNRSVENTQSAVGEIEQAVEAVRTQTERETKNQDRATSLLTELLSVLQRLSDGASSRRGDVARLREDVRETEQQMRATIQATEEISAMAESIGSMTRLIDDIAAQTNLLAMNAAIEAAHAGDQGRGFAVVAAEIRKLAEETASQSRRIGETMDSVAASIHTTTERADSVARSLGGTIDRIEGVAGEFEDISAELEGLGRNSQEINGSMAVLRESTHAVGSGVSVVEEQSRAVEEVARRLQESARTSTASLSALGDTFAQLQTSIRSIRTLVADSFNNSYVIECELERFKSNDGACVDPEEELEMLSEATR